MDPKEVKRLLKEARDAIKNKDSKNAVKLCKAVLKEDKNNYLGYVLLGAALQESDQHEEAPKAYRRANELSPDQPLAWQGLVSYFEKHKKTVTSDVEEDLLKAYAHLLPLERDTSKKQEFATRLGDLAVRYQQSQECIRILSKLPSDKEEADTIRRIMVKSLLQIKDLDSSEIASLGEALEHIIQDWRGNQKGNDCAIQDFYRQYLKFLYKSGQHKKLLQEAISMVETFNKDPYPLEWICKLWVEFVAEGRDISMVKDSISEYVNKLQSLSATATSVNMALGAIYYCQLELIKAREELSKVHSVLRAAIALRAVWKTDYEHTVASGQAPWQVYFLLADVELKFGVSSEAFNMLSNAKSRMKNISDDQEFIIMKCEAETLIAAQQENFSQKSVELCEKLLLKKPGDANLHLLLARAFVSLKRHAEAQDHLNEISSVSAHASKVTLLQAQILIHSGQKDQARFVLESVAVDAKDAEVWLTLARLHEEIGRHDSVLTDLMEAARCEPYFWETFMLLGNHYKSIATSSSFKKAKRCYQKAMQLNPKNDDCVHNLSDVLLHLNDTENHIELLDNMTRTNSSKWIWQRLGLLYTEKGDVEKAVNYLCNAIRIDPLDCGIWESLGDAYMVKGSWHAALKSFQKALQLSPGNIYASYQIGAAQMQLEEYEEAVKTFTCLQELSGKYVPALQGRGEAAFHLALTLRQQQRLGCARDRCQEAIDALTKVLHQRQDFSSTWKLLGGTFFLCAGLPVSYGNFHVEEWLASPSSQVSGTKTILLKRMDMFVIAEKMFCRAMSISPDNSELWHDLGTTNFYHAVASPLLSKRAELLQKAWTSAHQAVSLNTENSSHWNLLGVIAATEEIKKPAVAQHAFIQSINLDNANPVPWTNLGTLYLELGYIDLANKAFSAAQRLDHDYTRCWVGQALLAESLAHDDTVNLFSHTVTLRYHPESCLGFADWVLRTLLQNEKLTTLKVEDKRALQDFERMHALEVASDCMKWYTEQQESDPCGWNTLGLLLERQNLLRSARVALERGIDEAILAGTELPKLDALRCNLGRILVNLQDYQQSIDVLKQVTVPSFVSQSELGLALFKAQKYEEAYEIFNTTQEWLAPDDETKALIFMAMAAMLYGFNQLEECKTLLFQCLQPKPLSAHPLLALCAFGLLHKDIAMSKIMLKELARFKNDPKYVVHTAVLASYTAFLQGDQKGAVRALGKAVYSHPGEGRLWLSLAQLQMHAHPNCDVTAISRVARTALNVGRANIDVSKVQSLMSATMLLSGDGVSAAVSSQKAVHQFPVVAENWAILVASLLPLDSSPQHAAWLCDLVSHVRRRLQPSAGGLRKWLGNCEHHLTSLSSY